YRIFHRAVFFERSHYLGHGRAFLSDGNVNTDHVAALLIDDGVENNGSFTGLAVTDDQFALTAADRDHAVNGLDTCLQGLLNRLAVDDARRQPFQRLKLGRSNRTLAVDRLAERVDNAPDHGLANRDGHNAASTLYLVAVFDILVFAEQHGAYLIFFEVQRDADNMTAKIDQLAGHDVLKTINSRDAIADADYGSGLGNIDGCIVVFDFRAKYTGDF